MKKIYLTVDTECHDIGRINQYIYGKVNSDYFGLPLILSLGHKMGIPINVFLDIPECHKYGDNYIQEIVDLVHSYNQSIFFHFHPNFASNGIRSFLWEYSFDEQKKLLTSGINDYYRFCGKGDKLVFRAGRYGVDSNTYMVLEELGIDVVDLSFSDNDGKGMCHYSTKQMGFKNIASKRNNVIIFPNTSYIGFDYFGKRKSFLLNCALTTYDEFKRIILNSHLHNLVFTMHSWDLIRKYFFLPTFVKGDKVVIHRFMKCVNYAQNNGYVFSNLNDFSYEHDNDEQLNLCKGIKGKSIGLINNFIRFFSIARLNYKYFIFYLLFFIILIFVVAFFIFIL